MEIGLTLPIETDSYKDIGPKNKKPYELQLFKTDINPYNWSCVRIGLQCNSSSP
jgi:hypothetical protein